MIKESTVWKWLKPLPEVIGTDLFLQRIESRSTGAGIPDVYMCYKGYTTWIELKSWSTLSMAQYIWAKNHIRAGGTIYVIYVDKQIGCKMLSEITVRPGTIYPKPYIVYPLTSPREAIDIIYADMKKDQV